MAMLVDREVRPQVVDLDDDRALDPGACGNKAATLARLRRAGVTVPPGLVVPAEEVARAVPGDVGALAEQVAALAAERFGATPLAVRSSGAGEDGSEASFAGLFTTVLGVDGPRALAEAITRCATSADAAPVRAYRGGRPPAIAVLVQPMLAPTAAGVAFTADPVTGDRDVARVSAVAGLGDRLVAGEVTPDEWDVHADRATRRPEAGELAIDADAAVQVATAARAIADFFDGPQDVEWALVGGAVVVLQARPITALPIPPTLPEGTGWDKDTSHFPEQVSPFGGELMERLAADVMSDTASHFGLLIDSLEYAVAGGDMYARPVMSGGDGKPPPALLLGALARIVPPLRRKMSAARRIVDQGLLEGYPRRWDEEWRPQLQAAIDRHLDLDLATLDDAGLAAHGDELETFYFDTMIIHFRLAIPYMVAVREWAVTARELLGWDEGRALGALAGHSPASAEGGRDLAELRQRIEATPGAVGALRDSGNDPVGALRAVDEELAAGLERWLRRHGWRSVNYDAGGSTLIERPGLVVRLLLTEGASTAPPAGDGELRRARATLSEADRRRLDAALGFARLCYPQREDNVILTDNIPAGLLRRWLLEAGRRLVVGGRIERVEDAAFLTGPELRAALRGDATVDLGERVARRRGEWAWTRSHPGPQRIGPPEGDPPDLSYLPAPGRRINEALLWALAHEFGDEPADHAAPAGAALRGAPGSPGTYRGPVRIVRGEGDFCHLQPGEVLVCPVTTPAWAALFPLAGALVTNDGGVLSHAAIVAREHGLPAVLGTRRATAVLTDGQLVVVDGTNGTVTPVE